ncbi:MAG: VWA domain-containing protein [Halioglobus sp.]
MFELAHPWLLLLLVLPFFMVLLPAYKESRDSVKVPFFEKLVTLSEQNPQTGAKILQRDMAQRVLVTIMWIALVIAGAKPQWIGPPIEQKKSGRDLMIAVDLSGSMEAKDFKLPNGRTVDRLEAVKFLLGDLAEQRSSDRLGLLVFGSAAYLQTPFTDDHTVWTQLLQDTQIGMAGQSTVIGDAIGLAIKLFREGQSDNRVLIILTDGNDTGSVVPPIDAAKVAAVHNIRIYSIAMGDPTTVGEEAIDFKTIERIAQVTGGRAFEALDQVQLEQAYQTIGELEPELYETTSFRPRKSLHYLPIGFALTLFWIYHCVRAWRYWREQGRSHAA